jgi:uncharacterized cupin superfamily protein
MNETRWTTGSLAGATAMSHEVLGKGFLFGEQFPGEKFRDFGVNVRVVEPGQPTALYHAEKAEETFLVLAGECLAIVDDEEITLRQWDYLHCPPDTAHVLVGAGDVPCGILMIGGRGGEGGVRYPVSELAAKYGASVDTESDNFEDAWKQKGLKVEFEPTPLPWPLD